MKKLVLFVLTIFLTGCMSDQPAWLKVRRSSPNWESVNRYAQQYDFHWNLYGSRKTMVTQVFSTEKEVWVQLASMESIPAVFVELEDGKVWPLKTYRNEPYLVIKGNYQRLVFQIGKEKTTAVYMGKK
ncbi:TrbG/VirB9 family P-type conjugative transfer protein [Basilea psittacipulmonis]|uniref:TrbG/VirB9 family P-type conjugative transfer protein n=1 Tax=Basilea psittacipulmonis TaxID=1472345 RepID=UPI00068E4807|nr:TrbG/VirB9 family P-type conjugative transfer protein [Basilea psittacipulmonis]